MMFQKDQKIYRSNGEETCLMKKKKTRWDDRGTQKENPREKPQTKRGDFDFAQL